MKLLFCTVVVIITLLGCSSNPNGPHILGGSRNRQAIVDTSILANSQVASFAASVPERRLIESSYWQLNERKIKILDCAYAADSYNQHYYFWYESNSYSRRDFLKISPAHPLATLNEKPLTSCPSSISQAQTLTREGKSEYQLQAAERIKFLQTPPDNAKSANATRCLEVRSIVDGKGTGFRNNCNFAVHVAYDNVPINASDMGVRQNGAQYAVIPARGGFTLDFLARARYSYWACQHPMQPVSRTLQKQPINGQEPRDEWGCERPPNS